MIREVEPVDVSVIIPVGARHADLATLYKDYRRGLELTGSSFECIFVLDGPRAAGQEALEQLMRAGERIIVVSLTRPFGESTALMAGLQHAHAETIVTLPAYYQIEPEEIGKLLKALDGAHLAIAHRWPRAGNRFEAMRRGAFHGLLERVTGQRFRDLGCGARAMKRRVLEEISLYGDQHKFLPVLASRQGFRVAEVDVRQSPYDRFDHAYRPREYTRRALDIFTVFFLVRFTKKPLRFFGMVGASAFGIGALLTAWLVLDRLAFDHPLADRPALLLSSLLVVLGLQLFAIGLLGELIIFTHARDIKDYQVDRIIEFPKDPGEVESAAIDLARATKHG
jgi:glycosyltransferase involved in cell wall biosynthesis